MRTSATVVVLATLSASCGTMPLQPELLHEQLHQGSLFDVDEVDLSEYERLGPGTELPLRVGILPPLQVGSSRIRAADFGVWTDPELEVMERWANEAVAAGLATHVEFMPSMLAPRVSGEAGVDLGALRRVGARCGLDAVLVVRRLEDRGKRDTATSLLYATLIGAFLFDGTEYSAVTAVEGAVVDTRTGFLHAVGAAEALVKRRMPILTGDHEGVVREARTVALEDLARRLVRPLQAEARGVQHASSR